MTTLPHLPVKIKGNPPSRKKNSYRVCELCRYACFPATGACTNYECTNYDHFKGAISADELLRRYAPPALFHGRSWGDWTLDTARLVLVFRGQPVKRGGTPGGCRPYMAYFGQYELDIEAVRRSSNLLDFIFQINGKTWATARAMKDLVNAIDAIIRPQVNLCSCGQDKQIEQPAEFLTQRVAERRAV